MSLHYITFTVAFDEDLHRDGYLPDFAKDIAKMVHAQNPEDVSVLRWEVAPIKGGGDAGMNEGLKRYTDFTMAQNYEVDEDEASWSAPSEGAPDRAAEKLWAAGYRKVTS